MKNRSLIGLLLFAVALAGIYFFVKDQRSIDNHVRIGYLPIAAELPLFVAIENGYFEEAGISIELTRFTSSNELGNAATAGQIDFMAGTASNVIFDIFAVSGVRHRLIALNPYSNKENHKTDHLIVSASSDIRRLNELSGMRIASFPGSVNRIFVNLILEQYGVPRDSYEYIEMPPPNWQPALASGAIDAVSALEPSATQIIKDGVGISISQGFYAELMPEVPLSGHWIADRYFKETNRSKIDAFIKAYDKAILFCRNSEDEARKHLSKYANVREDILADVNLNPWQTSQEIDFDHVQEYVDLLFENDALQEKVDVRMFSLSNED